MQEKYRCGMHVHKAVIGRFFDSPDIELQEATFSIEGTDNWMVGRIGPQDFSLVPKTPSKTRRAVFPQRASQSRFTFQVIHQCEELQHRAA